MPLTTLATSRLRLLALTSDELTAYLDAPDELSSALAIRIADRDAETLRRPIAIKLAAMAETPIDRRPWYTYWMIVLPGVAGSDACIGMIGFKGAPDEQSSVEIGYGIAADYRRQGYATEAASALIAWAFAHDDCREIAARGVLKENISSRRVLAKLGMVLSRSDEDTLDYLLTRDTFQP